MKKNIIAIALSVLVAGVVFTSCEDALDTKNYTQADTSNFPARPMDMDNLMAAAYSILNHMQSQPLQFPYQLDNLMSDDCNGAGGLNDPEVKAVSHFLNYSETQFDWQWECTYKGIYRANTILETVDNCAWTDFDGGVSPTAENARGEAYFLRALYTFWATQLWGNIPMPTSTVVPNPCPEEDAETVIFPQILSDLYAASQLMKHNPADGHAGKGAAEALLARAYMWYVGFYKKAGELASANPEGIALVAQKGVPEGTVLTKQMVVDALEDCINNSGKSLVEDYRLLWNYSNKLTADSGYEYVADLAEDGEYWAGNGNNEQLFQIRFSNNASWNTQPNLAFSNQLALFVGLRCDQDEEGYTNGSWTTFPFGQGWGQGVASSNLWKAWSTQEATDGETDIRKTATVLDCMAELEHYAIVTTGCEDALYSMKKHVPVYANQTEDGVTLTSYDNNCSWWSCLSAMGAANGVQASCSIGNNMQAAHFADITIIRFADVLLMHTELTGNPAGMNEVRERAGLSDKEYTWQNIQKERHWELAHEGLRYQDLRRWSGTGAGAGSIVCEALEGQAGQIIWNKGVQSAQPLKHITCSWTERYTKTNGFIFKPYQQVTLSQGTVNQNPGWDVSAEPNAKYKVAY